METNQMSISQKVSYIKGLAEGLGVNDDTDEGKVIKAIIDVLGDMADYIEGMDDDLSDFADVVTDIEQSVSDLEDEVYGESDDDDECCCHHHGHHHFDEEDDMYEIQCPECGASTMVDFDTINGGATTCPSCGAKLELEFDKSLDDYDGEEE